MAYEDRRWRDDPKAVVVMCSHCKHRLERRGDILMRCTAFPDGIPKELMLQGEHDMPFPGDHGIRYGPKERTE